MHRTYLAGIERALRNPSLENLVNLANALGVTLPELFSSVESKRQRGKLISTLAQLELTITSYAY